MVFYWEVKFYPPVPEELNEDLTRYLVVLQIRQDLFTGNLPASFQTLALLGSYTAQGEIGDYDRHTHVDIDYLRPYSFAPHQSDELLARIYDLHKTRKLVASSSTPSLPLSLPSLPSPLSLSQATRGDNC